jgi:hypothetical protein
MGPLGRGASQYFLLPAWPEQKMLTSKLNSAFRLTLEFLPSASRTIATVANHNGVPNIGMTNMNLKPVELFHSPANSTGLPEGQLKPLDKGSMSDKGTSAKFQPPQFGSGSPQLTPSPMAAMTYGAWKNSQVNLKIYSLYSNSYATDQIMKAIKSGQSNDYIIIVDAGMKFSTMNASAMGGGEKRALQLTPKALSSEEFQVQYREADESEKNQLYETMKTTAKTMLPGNGLLRETEGSVSSELNAIIKSNASQPSETTQ